MHKTFFTNYIKVGLTVQCLSSAILQQWIIGRQLNGGMLPVNVHCSKLTGDDDVDCVWPPEGWGDTPTPGRCCARGAPTLGESDFLQLPGSIALLIHQSATHQCGTNQSCACVVIVIIFETLSQGQRHWWTLMLCCVQSVQQINSMTTTYAKC